MPEPCWGERWKLRPDGEMNRPRERSEASKPRYGVKEGRDKVQAPICKQARGRERAAHTRYKIDVVTSRLSRHRIHTASSVEPDLCSRAGDMRYAIEIVGDAPAFLKDNTVTTIANVNLQFEHHWHLGLAHRYLSRMDSFLQLYARCT